MKKNHFLLLLTLVFSVSVSAQDLSSYQKKEMVENGDTLRYRILLPQDYDPNRQYPLVFFLHGAGERGYDNEKQLTHGGELFLRDSIRKKYEAIVVFPQCPPNSYWSDVQITLDTTLKKRIFNFRSNGKPSKAMSLLISLYGQMVKDYHPAPDSLYVGGLSMGAMGTFELAKRLPDTFAAAFTICGGADTSTAPVLSQTAWSVYHGMKDDVVDPQFSIDMAAALKRAGAEVRLTLYPEANHNSWDSAFAEPDFISWIFNHALKK